MGSGPSKEDVGKKLENMEAALETKNNYLSEQIQQTVRDLNSLTNAKLDIAITGATGAGKSSLINALREIQDNEEGAAEIGVIQVMEPKGYPHPTFPNVTLWDLPGIGTPEFQAKEYVKKVNLTKYDFFIIVASCRITENDVLLTQEIQKTGKKFYCVHTKLDVDIASERRKAEARQEIFNEEETLERLREYCCDNLAKAGESPARVFLVSSRYRDRYDFQFLLDTMRNELDEIKRCALITELSYNSKRILKKKKAAMEALLEEVALVSSASGAITDPDLIVCDIPFLEATMRDFSKAFGLDQGSLCRLAEQVGKPVPVLSSAVKKTRLASQIDSEFVKGLLRRMCKYKKTRACCDFILFHVLQHFLDGAEEDAVNVLAKAIEN